MIKRDRTSHRPSMPQMLRSSNRMPGGLEFHEIADVVKPLRLFRKPIGGFFRVDKLGAFHGFGGSRLQGFPLVRIRHGGNRADVLVGGEGRKDVGS